jgi:hypothetical protein
MVSGDSVADARRQARTTIHSRCVCEAGWWSFRGEIIEFVSSAAFIPRIDRLERFAPDGRSLYIRVLIPACDPVGMLATVWCYVAPDLMQGGAVRMPGDSWP